MVDYTIDILATHFIAGEATSAGEGVFHSVNPRTGDQSSVAFPNATEDEIDRAVHAAAQAYEETRHYSPDKIASFLEAVADELDTLGDPLFKTTDAETALGFPRLKGELGRTTGQLRKFGALLREGSYVQAIIDTGEEYDIRRMLVPIGPVAVFSASNFPYAFAVAGGDTASAWAAGCPVVVKGHPAHPATSELFARAINRVIEAKGFPPGFFSMIQGAAIKVGQDLITHPQVAAVGFTGSLRAGRAIFNAAAERPVPIPIYAEMGSVNPMVVMPGALAEDAETLAQGLVNSLTLGTGQFCTNPGLVFVPEGDAGDAFIHLVAEKMGAAEPGILLNPQIESGLASAVEQTLSEAPVDKLTGGQTIAGAACQFEPTVLTTSTAVLRAHESIQREHFGPVVLCVTYSDRADLTKTIDGLHGQLTATIHATDSDLDEAGKLLTHLREIAGRLIWNGFPTGVAVVAAMQHGGPYPATTAPGTTSVGMTAVERFMRPVAYQSVPDALLPDALQDSNPLGILRKVNDTYTRVGQDATSSQT